MSAGPDRVGATLEETASAVRVCTRCPLHTTRTHAVPGEGPSQATILLLGEAPGRDEDASGRPFVGRAGKILDRSLAAAGIERASVFITNVVKCRPPKNRRPKGKEVAACRLYLLAQIEAARPRVVVTLGATALHGLLGPGHVFKAARREHLRFGDVRVLATYHPAAVLYNRNLEGALRRDLARAAQAAKPARRRVLSRPARKDRETRPAVSCGGVILDAAHRVLLLRRADEGIWCLPKGTMEAGETPEGTALREIEEESGLQVRLVRPAGTIAFTYYWPPHDVNYARTVVYFLAEPVHGEVRLEPGFDAFRWASKEEALRLLHWEDTRGVVRLAFELARKRAD